MSTSAERRRFEAGRGVVRAVAIAALVVVATAGAARADYCHPIGYAGCLTEATQFCSNEPIRPDNLYQALAACEACFGYGQCTYAMSSCGVYGFRSVYGHCPVWEYTEDCDADRGVVSSICTGQNIGQWADSPSCFDGTFQPGLEQRTDCGGSCSQSCCDSDGTVNAPYEACDDGNAVDGDGCSSCAVDDCYGCTGAPSSCSAQPGASCTDDGNPCTVEVCSASGECTHPAGNDGGACADDGNFCTSDVCAAGACSHPAANEGVTCDDDGNGCTVDQCMGGTCAHPGDTGAACADDGNPCTLDQCDASGACVHPSNVGAACDADGNDCTLDVCDASGACTHPGNVGAPCSEDGNPCTLDQCDAAGDCVHPPAIGAPCEDDGNECTNDVCGASASCEHPAVGDGASCDDESACTQVDQCESGVCTGTHPVVCCNGQSCNSDDGACAVCPEGYEPAIAWSQPACRKTFSIGFADLDFVSSSCSPGEPVSSESLGFHWTDPGDPQVGNVLDYSVSVGASLMSTAAGFETIPVTLNGQFIGSYGLQPNPGCGTQRVARLFNNNPTAAYSKNAVNSVVASWSGSTRSFVADANGHYATVQVFYGRVPATPLADGTACDDGNACTVSDQCHAGTCDGAPVACTALDDCHTVGLCDPDTGECSSPPRLDGNTCDDGNACTSGDVCQGGACIGFAMSCGAASACQQPGVCNSSTGLCDYDPQPNGTACSDGNACTQTDTCQAGVCTGENPVSCGPAPDQCHTAVCSPATGACEYPEAPPFSFCDDGSACTYFDHCFAGTCSGYILYDGAYCEDGDLCTVDSCQAGVCTPGTPIACKASDLCHEAGTCNPATGICSTPAPIECDDGSACTADSCDPDIGCVAEPEILPDCLDAGRAKLAYLDNADDGKDKLKWTWSGASTSQLEFGDPLVDADYRLCVFATVGGVTTSFLEAEVPPSQTLWTPVKTSGYKFLDKPGSSDGITKIGLKGSSDDKTKIGFAGRGAGLGDPMLPLGPSLTGLQVQLTNLATGVCWQSEFAASSIKHDEKRVSASAP